MKSSLIFLRRRVSRPIRRASSFLTVKALRASQVTCTLGRRSTLSEFHPREDGLLDLVGTFSLDAHLKPPQFPGQTFGQRGAALMFANAKFHLLAVPNNSSFIRHEPQVLYT